MAIPLASYIVRTRGRARHYTPAPCLREARRFSGRASYRSLVGNRGYPFFRIGVVPEPAIFEFFPFLFVFPSWPGGRINFGILCATAFLALFPSKC